MNIEAPQAKISWSCILNMKRRRRKIHKMCTKIHEKIRKIELFRHHKSSKKIKNFRKFHISLNPHFKTLNPHFFKTPPPTPRGGYVEIGGIRGFNILCGFKPYGYPPTPSTFGNFLKVGTKSENSPNLEVKSLLYLGNNTKKYRTKMYFSLELGF